MKGWALVTGSAGNIGRAIALELAGQGWDIVVHYRRSADAAKLLAQEIHALGRDAALAEIDLSNAAVAENLIPSLVRELGMIDVVVNNAGLHERDETDPDGSRHWAVNADAPRLLGKAFRASMAKGERGVMINVLDAACLAADAVPAAPYAAYGKSKVFLADMTRNMAKSFAPHIRVNGVAPGFVLPAPARAGATATGRSEDEFQDISTGRIVTPQQVATAVRQLVETPAAQGEIVKIA